MSTRWKCTMLQEYHGPVTQTYKYKTYTAKDIFFQIHVKNPTKVVLKANNATLEVVATNATAIDAEAHYTYDDGEDVDFTCEKSNYNLQPNELRLEYYNAQGKPSLTLYVNGERQLLRHKQHDADYDDYIPYTYIQGEQLNITCKRDKTLKGDLLFNFLGNTTKGYIVSESEIMLPFNTLEHNIAKSLVCCINNTKVQKLSRIEFVSVLPESGVRIIGLPRQNIMYQYTNDSVWTTAYQFTVNETLNLTCVTKDGASVSNQKFIWTSDDLNGSVTSGAKLTRSITLVSKTTYIQVLEKRHNQTHIRCTYQKNKENKQTAEIILHLKPEMAFVIIADERSGQDSDIMIALFIISVVAAIIVVVAATICTMFLLKRKKHARLIENAYEDLQSRNESPIPAFPRQWENEYTYCTQMNTGQNQENNTYASIYDKFNKIQSNETNEHHYTEIDDYFKHKIDRRNATYNSDNPTAGPSVNILDSDNFNHENGYQNVDTPFRTNGNNYLNHDVPTNNSLLSNNYSCSNVSRKGKNKIVSFQENVPTRTEERITNDLNPFRNNRNTGFKENQNKTKENKQAKDINYENVSKDNKSMENSSVYAEPHCNFDEMVINTLYGKI
uniref:Uncharacterized protein n=1 Tax=Heliothis virescens TaxID=7102 RepID=A0A2A4JX95_HELVI